MVFSQKTTHADVIKSAPLYVTPYEVLSILFCDMDDVKTMVCAILHRIE
jgi:hypothetical protein